METLAIAVIGGGIIGRTHIETLGRCPDMRLSALVDPAPEAAALARANAVPCFASVDRLIAAGVADAVIVASPNQTHVAIASECLRAGLPVLLEKPVAGTLAEGRELLALAEEVGTPLLIGHHRRHNPIIKAAKAAIDEGAIGDLVSASVLSTLAKPAAYFDVAWRVAEGQGGPLAINLIHEIDLLRHFFGEVTSVLGHASADRRALPVEDTAAAILTFERGGVASLAITDAGAGPWAWDLTAGENPSRFPSHDVFAHAYSGTNAALSLPDLALWRHPGEPDWTRPMQKTILPHARGDAYVEQIAHFAEVARGRARPLVSCEDGLRNMQVVDAIRRSARSGGRVDLGAPA